MVPHLWAVYSTRHMKNVPIKILSQNSVYFRHFDQSSDSGQIPIAPPQRKDDASEQPLFRCTALNSFALTSISSPEQIELLHTNPGIVSLQWLDFCPSEVSKTISDIFHPLSTTVRELSVQYTSLFRAPAPTAMMSTLANLKPLHVNSYPQFARLSEPTTPALFEFLAASTGSVRYHPLEQLTVPQMIFGPITNPLLVKIPTFCPRIEHLVVEMDRHFIIGNLASVHKTVLNWGAVYQAWIRSLDAAPSEMLIEDTQRAATIENPGTSGSGWQKLDIHLYGRVRSKLNIHILFERECRDLVGLSAYLESRALLLATSWIQRFSHTVQHVDLECNTHMYGSTFRLLGQILRSMTALRRLRFVIEAGLTKEESIRIFRENRWQQNDEQDEVAVAVAETGKTEDAHSAWASRYLEILIKGLWGTLSYDHPEKDDAVTLQAASEMHQWVVYGSSGVDKRFRKVVSDRVQTLPALRTLILNSAAFEYAELRSHIEALE